ncbi:type II secretion system F family protein [Shimazuella kribbensis]|uniref:type II secretion system F family protein n=1 Tax=Shimazuella kribbensis TaxID=139808 RepID=UPI00048F3D12|nr:type II secretion system F family protein [Shimazuella kribbensis]
MHNWKNETIASFSYHLKNIIESGISLVDSIQMLTLQQVIPENKGNKLIQMIQQGESFSNALQEIRFPVIFCSFIQAAELHGNLIFALQQCHRYYLTRAKWVKKMKKVMFYPVFILSFLCLGLVFLSIVVLPSFSALYESFSYELPATTRFVFTLSHVFPYLIVLMITLLLLCIWGRRRPTFQVVFVRVPFIAAYYRYRYTQYLSLQLGSFMVAGVPMLSTITLLEQITPWPTLSNYLTNTKQKLIDGDTLSNIVQEDSEALLPIFSQTVVLGEETGKLGEMLGRLAITTEEWLAEKIEKWMTYLEPILTLFIGLVMAIVVISLFLPMFGLIQAVQ